MSEVPDSQETHPPGQLCHQPATRSVPPASCGSSCSIRASVQVAFTMTQREATTLGPITVPAPWVMTHVSREITLCAQVFPKTLRLLC